jgi:ubiquitin C-terminal hydrolase
MNGIIQCLSHTLPLTDHLLKNYIPGQNVIYSSFINLLDKLWTDNTVINASGFHKHFSSNQEDSHEFLIKIIDTLETATQYNVKYKINGPEITERDTLDVKYYKEFIKHALNKSSFILHNFYGSLIRTTNDDEILFEFFNCLSLPIQHDTLSGCIDSYLGDNTFWTLPNILILHLSRYTNDGNKIKSLVTFPYNLNMTNKVSKKKCDKNNYMYSLYAVNYHIGTSTDGHYLSACKDINGEWYTFDDENVRKTSQDKIINEHAYILFYQRQFIREAK